MDSYFALNRQLFDYTFDFVVYNRNTDYQVPVYFVSGSDDWICPVDSVQEKVGFKYRWQSEDVDVPLMHEKRTGHVSLMIKEDWEAMA